MVRRRLARFAGVALIVVALGSLTFGTAAQSPSANTGALGSEGCGLAAAEPLPEILALTSGGVDREALIHVPPAADPARPMPLVVAFHGYTAGPYDQEWISGLSALADGEGFVAAYPSGTGNPRQWELPADTDVTFTADLIDALEARLCIDQRRIYATGFSMGGGMADVVGCRLADRVAAIAPVSALHGESWGGECRPSRPVPIISFHAVDDPVNPYAGGDIVGVPEWAGRPGSPTEEWMADWALVDGCAPDPIVTDVADGVELLAWSECDAPVELYRIQAPDHAWPGGTNDPPASAPLQSLPATDLIWAFLETNPLPA
jgi:polyhydroxybutyrate depolymerase